MIGIRNKDGRNSERRPFPGLLFVCSLPSSDPTAKKQGKVRLMRPGALLAALPALGSVEV